MFQKIKSWLLENRNFRQTIMKNAFWLTVSNVLGRVIKAVLIIFAARILGVASYGIFSYALSLAAFFTIFSDIGLGPILTRETAKKTLPREYFSTTLTIKFALVSFSVLLVIFVAPFFTKIPEAINLLPIVALLIFFDSLRDFSYSLTRAWEKMEWEALISIFTNVAITVLGILILLLWPTNKNLVIGYTLGSALGLMASIFVLRRRFLQGFKFIFNKNLAKKILQEAWPFALLGFLGGIMINTDTLMLGWMKTASDLGYYAAAQRPVQFLYLIPAIIATAVFPTFSRLAGKDNNKFRSLLEKSIRSSLLFAIPITLGGLILAPQIISLLFGNSYLPATTAFIFLLLTILLTFPGTLIGNAIFAHNKQQQFIGYLALGALGNVVFNAVLIPPFGISGAAFATILAQTLAIGFNWKNMKKINNFQTLKYLPRIVLAGLLMTGLVFILKIWGVNIIINILIAAPFYFLCLYWLKEPLLALFNFPAIIKKLIVK